MTPTVAIVTLTALVWLLARWRRAGGWNNYDLRAEWPSWAFAAAAIGVAVVLSGGGRLVLLPVAAGVLISGGIYLIVDTGRAPSQRDPRMRLYGWLAIAIGVLITLAFLSSLAVGAP